MLVSLERVFQCGRGRLFRSSLSTHECSLYLGYPSSESRNSHLAFDMFKASLQDCLGWRVARGHVRGHVMKVYCAPGSTSACVAIHMFGPCHRCSCKIAKPLPAGSYHAGLQGTQPLQS